MIWWLAFACDLTSCFHLWLDDLFYLSFENMFLLVISLFVFTYLLVCFFLLVFTCDLIASFYLWFHSLFLLVIWILVFACDLMTCFYFWFDGVICFNTVWTLSLHEVSRIEWKSQYAWIQSMLLRYQTDGRTGTHPHFGNILFLILNRNKRLCCTYY